MQNGQAYLLVSGVAAHVPERCAELNHLVVRKALFILQGQQRIKESERLKGCAENVLLASSVF